MSSMTVVAIPENDDPVWKISSEKIPHMTILFLGDQEVGPKTANMVDFVEHAAKTTLKRFGASVDRRGTLGPDDADVLFFEKYGLQSVAQFRSFLLTNENINAAYNSTMQYPEWTPHLTLGYPTAPAKENGNDQRRMNWVSFDRIAFWTGDFEGPEFILDRYYPEEVSMSDLLVADLAHHGVKGMKWGVRRRSGSDSGGVGSSASNASADAQSAAAAEKKSKKTGVDSLSNQELQTYITRMNLEQQYSKLKNDNSSTSKAEKRIKRLLSTGKTLQEVYSFLNGPLGKDLRKALQNR